MTNRERSSGPHIGFDESQCVEFKQTWVEGAMKDIVAFANTDGGTLYIGVDKQGMLSRMPMSRMSTSRKSYQRSATISASCLRFALKSAMATHS